VLGVHGLAGMVKGRELELEVEDECTWGEVGEVEDGMRGAHCMG
jgi:hypothetical protein